jgi:hypothetical protein
VKRTPTQEKARRADSKALERAMLRALRGAPLDGWEPASLPKETTAVLAGLERARRQL